MRRGGEGARLFVVAAAVVAGRRGGILFANVKRSQSVQKGRWHCGGQKAGQTRGRLEKTGLSAGTNSRQAILMELLREIDNTSEKMGDQGYRHKRIRNEWAHTIGKSLSNRLVRVVSSQKKK